MLVMFAKYLKDKGYSGHGVTLLWVGSPGCFSGQRHEPALVQLTWGWYWGYRSVSLAKITCTWLLDWPGGIPARDSPWGCFSDPGHGHITAHLAPECVCWGSPYGSFSGAGGGCSATHLAWRLTCQGQHYGRFLGPADTAAWLAMDLPSRGSLWSCFSLQGCGCTDAWLAWGGQPRGPSQLFLKP